MSRLHHVEEQLSIYATYMATLGNRPDLFGQAQYSLCEQVHHQHPPITKSPEYLNDDKFAAMIAEAEKYIGYPYVWGGSSPSTSFDCSGFVSYVLTNSGLVNTGRFGAQGLYNVCTPVSKANAQPGDLIFFVGTYDTPGVSHVGIYVGDRVMMHCGDPIRYTSINSSYWQHISTPLKDPPIKRKEFLMIPKYQKVLSASRRLKRRSPKSKVSSRSCTTKR